MTDGATPDPGGRPVPWRTVADTSPDLARTVVEQLQARPSYLATVDAKGHPRVHPVTPIVSHDHLLLFMEPTSPKGRDIRERRHYALHNGVPDSDGTGGECILRGEAWPADDPGMRELAVSSASYTPEDRYVLFELGIGQITSTRYQSGEPVRQRWPA